MAKTWKTIAIYRLMEAEVERCTQKYVQGALIDIGCGTQPYRSIAAPHVTRYVGLDVADPFNRRAQMDVMSSAEALAVKDESFDSAFCHAALEHLPEPETAIRECHRVLKRGGVAFYMAPFFWQLHSEPRDYYRFTKYGLKHLFEKAGFEVLEIQALSGYWVTTATMFCYYLERFESRWLRRLRIFRAIGVAFQALACRLDKADKAEPWTWMYSVVAVKR
jgi:SAM-dependent methyltransferase